MSQENVESVLGLQPPADADFAGLIRDENFLAMSAAVVAQFFHPDFECALPRFDSEKTYTGMDGLRALWLDWMTPWKTYRSEVEEAVDLGDRVLLLVRDLGRREENAQEIALLGAAVWTLRAGVIIRAEFYPSRAEALQAVGLEA